MNRTYRVNVRVLLKAGVLDAPGQVIESSLHRLGFGEVGQVRVGRYISMDVQGPDEASVTARVRTMGDQLLAHPVVEDFEFDLQELSACGPGRHEEVSR